MTEEKKHIEEEVSAEEEKEETPEETVEKEEESAKEEPQKKESSDEPTEEPVEVPKKFKDLVESIEKMSVLDLAELVKILEKKFGVSSVQMAAPAAGAAASEGSSAEGKSTFTIELTGAGDKKIEVIKIVREITQKGLKECKDLVDAVETGSQVIRENVKKEEAEDIKKKLEEAGAKVELK